MESRVGVEGFSPSLYPHLSGLHLSAEVEVKGSTKDPCETRVFGRYKQKASSPSPRCACACACVCVCVVFPCGNPASSVRGEGAVCGRT